MKPAIILTACGVGLALTVALTSCSTETQVVTPEQKVEVAGKEAPSVKIAGTRYAGTAKITQMYVKELRKCIAVKKDCFETIIVEADCPGLTAQIGSLDGAIDNGTGRQFFETQPNYSAIWSSMPSAVLADLRAGQAVIQRASNVSADRRQYYLVGPDGESLDYSGVN